MNDFIVAMLAVLVLLVGYTVAMLVVLGLLLIF